MKRTLSFSETRETALVAAGLGLIACTYGLVRLAYGLYLPDVQASVGLGDAAAGYVSSGASVAYCVGALLGVLASGRALVIGAVATAAAGSAGMAAATGLTLFVPAAIVASAGAGLASPGLVRVVEGTVREVRRDRAQAVVNAGTGPGLVLAGLLALALLPHWRVGLGISALATVATGVAVLLLGRAGDTAAPVRVEVRALARPALAAALLGTASAVVWTYGRTRLEEAGASEALATLAWVALGVGGSVTVLTARRLSALAPTRAWALTVATVAGSVVALAVGPLGAALLVCAVFGWGFVAATSALIAWGGQVQPAATAGATAVLFVALVLGQAGGSAAAGALADLVGLPATFALASGVAALAAAVSRRRVHPACRPRRTT